MFSDLKEQIKTGSRTTGFATAISDRNIELKNYIGFFTMKTFYTLILSVAFGATGFAQSDSAGWVSMPPENLMPIENRGAPMAKADVYEVIGSLSDTAINALLRLPRFSGHRHPRRE